MRGIQDSSNEKAKNSHKVNNVILSSLNQRYDIIICVYWFELFSQVSDVAHGPLVFVFLSKFNKMSSVETSVCLLTEMGLNVYSEAKILACLSNEKRK